MRDADEHSVSREPHRVDRAHTPDPSEARTDRLFNAQAASRKSGADVENCVWDEPSTSPTLAGAAPADAPRYELWLARNRAAMTPARSWSVTALIALAAGPWAVTGALFSADQGIEFGWGVLAIVLFGPVIEEVMKVALPLWLLEKKPYLFTSALQLMVCAAAGGLAFATLENLLYLNVYIRDPSPTLVTWRWTVCTALHVGCSTLAGVGLTRVWSDVWKTRKPAELSLATPMITAAIVVHGTYNALAVALHLMDFDF